MIKKFLPIIAFALTIIGFGCQEGGGDDMALIETDMGNIKVKLYDSTPKHKENFIKLVKEGYYDNTLFHRVIPGFMVQGGDPDSKTASAGQQLGQGGPGYTIDAEIGAPHFRGVLAAARQPDQVNPEKKIFRFAILYRAGRAGTRSATAAN